MGNAVPIKAALILCPCGQVATYAIQTGLGQQTTSHPVPFCATCCGEKLGKALEMMQANNVPAEISMKDANGGWLLCLQFENAAAKPMALALPPGARRAD